VEVATTGWPEGGDLASSTCLYDGLACTEEEEEENRDGDAQGQCLQMKKSMRRAAICCLADMCQFEPLGLRMAAAKLVDRGLPTMIKDSLAR
jgi:hypothetical protein